MEAPTLPSRAIAELIADPAHSYLTLRVGSA